jgi:hypothetical protein
MNSPPMRSITALPFATRALSMPLRSASLKLWPQPTFAEEVRARRPS